MQTFLPHPNFTQSAETLDRQRLCKQRVETMQILRALTIPGYGWANHPAVVMWAGSEEALTRYGLDVCAAWTAYGYRDTCAGKLVADLHTACGIQVVRTQQELAAAGALPAWLGDPDLHRSHQSNLIRKAPDHYGPQFPGVPASED